MTAWRALAGYGAIIALAAATVASGETNEAVLVTETDQATTEPLTSPDSTGPSSTAPSPAADEQVNETFTVGDRVAIGDWQIEVHEFTDPYDDGNQFLGPDTGSRWVALDVEVFNAGDQPREVTSIFCFDLQDELNRNFDQELFADTKIDAPNGEVQPGASRRGTIVFEIPDDASGLRLNFKSQFLSTGSVTIRL
ncbi:MAG: DUF4352 domain-containing protein [Actinomycetia bacterium]|nr:DUF4352 domain-containing protein [Actinomycetes bacterium]